MYIEIKEFYKTCIFTDTEVIFKTDKEEIKMPYKDLTYIHYFSPYITIKGNDFEKNIHDDSLSVLECRKIAKAANNKIKEAKTGIKSKDYGFNPDKKEGFLVELILNSGLSQKSVAFIFTAIGFFIGLAVLAPFFSTLDTTVLTCIIIGLMIICYFYGDSLGKKVDRKVNSSATILPSSFKMVLHSRNKISGNFLQVSKVVETVTQYNPSELIYTSVTVVGVTTGGVDKTKATLTEKYSAPSNKALIQATLRDGKCATIKTIELNDSLVKEAEKHPFVSKFLNGNELILRYNTPDTELTKEEKDAMFEAIRLNDYAAKENIPKRAYYASLLTRDECKIIINWVSGKE